MFFCRSSSIYLPSGPRAKVVARAGMGALEVSEIEVGMLLLLEGAYLSNLSLLAGGKLR